MLFAGLSKSFGTLWGIWSLTFLSTLGERAGIEDFGILPNINIVIISLYMIHGIGLVIVGYGIGRMSRWALYIFTVLTLITIISLIYSYMVPTEQNLNDVIFVTIQVLILIYLWSISKRFI